MDSRNQDSRIDRAHADDFINTAIGQANREVMMDVGDCTCHLYCGDDSHSGRWHVHEGDPCPVHKDAPVVG